MKAILDTDFLFKTHLARDGNNKPLADLIIEMNLLGASPEEVHYLIYDTFIVVERQKNNQE